MGFLLVSFLAVAALALAPPSAAQSGDVKAITTDSSVINTSIRELLDKFLEKIKDAVDYGKTVKQELFDKLKELREKLKDLKIDVGEKAKELLQKIKDKAKDFLRDLLDRLGLKD